MVVIMVKNVHINTTINIYSFTILTFIFLLNYKKIKYCILLYKYIPQSEANDCWRNIFI